MVRSSFNYVILCPLGYKQLLRMIEDIHVGRLGICLFVWIFGFENFHTCNQCRDGFKPKIPWANDFFESLGGCQSWHLWNFSHNYVPPLLVDFKYLFLNKFPGLETLYTCYQHKDDLVPKISCWNNKLSAQGRVLKLEAIKWFFHLFLTSIHVGRFGILFFVWIFWTWVFLHM